MGKYLLNKETQKIEMHFEKSEYLNLSNELKKEINSRFLWSGKSRAWVSRSKNNHYYAIQTAKKLKLDNAGEVGERLSYEEELERKTERAEARAECYEQYSENAIKRAEQLQSELKSKRGDIAFFTQPIIAGHSGSRSFANYREKLYKRYEKGFEEYDKSAYYKERAEIARATANNEKLKDKIYLHNKIKEQNKKIKNIQTAIIKNENTLYRVQQGEKLHARYTDEVITIDDMEKLIAENIEKYDYEQGKLDFFENCINELGGIQFSKDNIKVGYIINLGRWGKCEVVGAGKVNITFKILEGGAIGGVLTEPYAAITEILEIKETSEISNPYQIGDILCAKRTYNNSIYKAFQVVKITKTGVKIQQIDVSNGKPVPNNFIDFNQQQKKVVKSIFNDWVGVYLDNWQLHKYNVEDIEA